MPPLEKLRARVARLGTLARLRAEESAAAAKGALSAGILREPSLPGAQVLLREAARGKLTPSTLFRYLAAARPDDVAIVDPRSVGPRGEPTGLTDREIRFAELDDRMERVGRGLAAAGVGKRDGVLVMTHNRPEFVELQPAIGRIGGSAVSVSYRSTAAELEYLARHSRGKALVFEAGLAPIVEDALDRLARPGDGPASALARERCFALGDGASAFPSYTELLASRDGAPAPDRSEDAAVVMYTSGTTGKPKGAVRRFPKSVLGSALAFVSRTPMQRGDVHLVALPMYHATAFGFATLTFVVGGSLVVPPEVKPESFVALVQRYRVTTSAVVPTLLHRLLELPPGVLDAHDLSSLRALFSGGAPLSAPLALAAMGRFGDVLYNFYGATETGLVTLAGPADLRAAPGTIGRPLPGNHVRLLDDAGREVGLGGVGELFVQNQQLVEGYHDDEEATRGSLREGFFSVGDLARRDAEGRYFIEGRKRDMIISGGVNVYPAEVEAALDAHPAVKECAVVGMPDPEWGERVKAFAVLKAGAEASPDELRAFLKQRIAGPKVPRDIELLGELPKNPTGKVLKRELRLRGQA